MAESESRPRVSSDAARGVIARGEGDHPGVVVCQGDERGVAAARRSDALLGDGLACGVEVPEAGEQLGAQRVQRREQARHPAHLGDAPVGAGQRVLMAARRREDAGEVHPHAVGTVRARPRHPDDGLEPLDRLVEPVLRERAERVRVGQLAGDVGVGDVEGREPREQRVGILHASGDRRAPGAERQGAGELGGIDAVRPVELGDRAPRLRHRLRGPAQRAAVPARSPCVDGAALGVLGRRQQLERRPQRVLGGDPAAAVGLRGRELDA